MSKTEGDYMSKIVVVDVRLLMFRLFHKKQNYVRVTSYLMSLINRIAPCSIKKVIFAIDAGYPFRGLIYPAYKANRSKKNREASEADQERLQQFNKDYNNMIPLLNQFGTVMSINGKEADDIASIITNAAINEEILLVTADVDWTKFLKNSKHSMLHVSREKEVHYKDVEAEFKTLPENKAYIDSIIGVPKENVKGVFRLGLKKVLPLFKPFGASITLDNVVDTILPQVEDIISKSKSMALPDGHKTLQEMFEFNYELFKSFTFAMLTKDEKDIFKKQFNTKPERSLKKIEEIMYMDFNTLAMLSKAEKDLYNLS